MSAVKDCIQKIVEANHILAHEGVVDAFGHVSARHPEDPTKFILSRSRSPALVSAEDMMVFNLDGTVVGDDGRKPYLERFIHGGVYEARPEVQAVIHDHSHEVLPFTISTAPLKPVLHTCGAIGPKVPVWDIRDNFGGTNLMVTNIAQARDLAKAMGKNPTALMRGHGAVVAATNIIDAVLIAIYLNINAEALFRATLLGGVKHMTAEEVEKSVDGLLAPLAARRAFDYFLRRAGYDIAGD